MYKYEVGCGDGDVGGLGCGRSLHTLNPTYRLSDTGYM